MNLPILSLWGVWDTIYQRCTRLQYVEKGKNIFRFVLLRYRGEPLISKNATVISSGDLIIKLHIHNYFFATQCYGIKNDARVALILRKHIVSSLPDLARLVAEHPRAEEIKGIVGTTMIDKGVEYLGFSVSDVPCSLFFRCKRWYLLFMRKIIHPDGGKLRRDEHDMRLKRVFMSKDELLDLYLHRARDRKQSETGELLV